MATETTTPLAPTPTPTGDVPPPSPVPAVPDSRLPEGVKLNTSLNADIDKWFDGEEGTPAPTPGAKPISTTSPAPAPKAEPQAAAPAPGSVAAKLAAKKSPPAASAPKAEATPPPAGETPPKPQNHEELVSTIEAQMRAQAKDPKHWKPSDGWNTVKGALKAESERRAQLERELEETKKQLTSPVVAGMTAKEIEELRAREKAASDRLLVMDLENHPQFRAQYVEPKQAELAKAGELLAAHNVKVDLAALVAKPRNEIGKALAEVLKDVPEFDRVEVAESVRKAYQLEQGAKAALTQKEQLAKALQTQSAERQKQAFSNKWMPVSAAITEYMQQVDVPANASPEERASIESYNAAIGSLRQKAESIAFGSTSEEAVAENSIKAAAYDLHVSQVLPRVLSDYEQVVDLNRQLVRELNELRGRNPNHRMGALPAGGGTGPTGDPATSDPRQMDHAHAADHFFGKG